MENQLVTDVVDIYPRESGKFYAQIYNQSTDQFQLKFFELENQLYKYQDIKVCNKNNHYE